MVATCRGISPERQHESWLGRLAQHHVCNATSIKRLLVERHKVPDAAVTVIPNGVDTATFRPAQAGSAGGRVLAIGRLAPDKDHGTLIRAFARVLDDHPTAQLTIVGEGEERDRLERLAATLLPSDRFRLEAPTGTDVVDLYHRADLVVLSSVREGAPNVLLEAMACGLPVVATAVGGVPDLVADGVTGLLVPSGDPVTMAGAIGRLLSDPAARAAFGRAGRERVERQFSIAEMVRAHEVLFDRLLA